MRYALEWVAAAVNWIEVGSIWPDGITDRESPLHHASGGDRHGGTGRNVNSRVQPTVIVHIEAEVGGGLRWQTSGGTAALGVSPTAIKCSPVACTKRSARSALVHACVVDTLLR